MAGYSGCSRNSGCLTAPIMGMHLGVSMDRVQRVIVHMDREKQEQPHGSLL